jgi:hypothetical protein
LRICLTAGFADPFSAVEDVTLDNPAYKPWGWSLMKVTRVKVYHMLSPLHLASMQALSPIAIAKVAKKHALDASACTHAWKRFA